MPSYTITAPAERDITTIIGDIGQENPSAAERFSIGLESTIEALSRMPHWDVNGASMAKLPGHCRSGTT
jgi:plasmid stabilization system protein ParE